MYALSLLTSLLREKGLITDEEAARISSLYMLSSMANGKLKLVLTEQEQIYVGQLEQVLEYRPEAVRGINPPDSLSRFHKSIVASLPYLKMARVVTH